MRMGPQETVWITGAAGRMGEAIERQLDHGEYCILTTDAELDVTNLEEVDRFVAANRPDIVINCAGMPRTPRIEADHVAAYRTNALGARNVAIASASIGAMIVHLSTDDVFSGKTKRPINEFDTPHPESVYGRSKLAGEAFVRELNPRHIIVRSSWIYCNRENDLLTRILAAGRANERFEVAANQIASPTSISTYARFIVDVMRSGEFGLFHATTEGTCSRLEFAKRVLELAGLSTACLAGTYEPEDAYHLDLENLMLHMTGVYRMPTWEDDLQAFMAEHGLLA